MHSASLRSRATRQSEWPRRQRLESWISRRNKARRSCDNSGRMASRHSRSAVSRSVFSPCKIGPSFFPHSFSSVCPGIALKAGLIHCTKSRPIRRAQLVPEEIRIEIQKLDTPNYYACTLHLDTGRARFFTGAASGSVATLQECFDKLGSIWSPSPQSPVCSNGANLNRK